MTVTVSDWSEGFRKVSFNDLLREYCGYSLGDAKRAVDRLLDHEPLEIEIVDQSRALEFSRRAIEIGAVLQSPVPNAVKTIGIDTAGSMSTG